MSILTRRDFNAALAKGLGAVALACPSPFFSAASAQNKKNKRPNFVFICSDQHSNKYVGCMGHPHVKTPHLDKIAKKGVFFTDHYAGSPICVPGRASMMTGMYASDCNSFCNSTVWDGRHPTWGSRLKEAGYDCWAWGKMDLNDAFDMGFEGTYSNKHCKDPDITTLFRRPSCFRASARDGVEGAPRDKRHKDEQVAQSAIDYIRSRARETDKPWVVYVGLHQPHPKFTGLRKYYDIYARGEIDMPTIPDGHLEDLHLVFQERRHHQNVATPIPEERVRRARLAYYAMITELDEYIGRIWDALKESGQLDNTIFIYTSDHGESLGEHGQWSKSVLYDVAARVPLVMAGAGIPKNVRVDNPVGHVDLIATMLERAGIARPKELRGRSLTPLMHRRKGDHPGFAFSESHSSGTPTGSYMIRKGDWKYIHFTYYDDLLFNVKEDPGEFHNRVDDPKAQEILAELKGILFNLIDPDEITFRAFHAQDMMLRKIADGKSEEELAAALESRLGKGQARILAARVKGR